MFEAIMFLVICYSSLAQMDLGLNHITIIKHKLGVFKSHLFLLGFGQSIQVNPPRSPFDSRSDNQKVIKATQ